MATKQTPGMLNNIKKWVQTAVDDMLDEDLRRPCEMTALPTITINHGQQQQQDAERDKFSENVSSRSQSTASLRVPCESPSRVSPPNLDVLSLQPPDQIQFESLGHAEMNNLPTTNNNKSNRSSSIASERTNGSSVGVATTASRTAVHYLSVDLEPPHSSDTAATRKASLQLLPTSSNVNKPTSIKGAHTAATTVGFNRLIKTTSQDYNDWTDGGDPDLVEIVIDSKCLRKTTTNESDPNVPGHYLSTNSTTSLEAKPKPKRKLPSTPSGLNHDPAAMLSPYSSHFSIPSSRSNKPTVLVTSVPLSNPKPKLVENVTEWLNKSFDQTKLSSVQVTNGAKNVDESISQYKSAQHLLNIDGGGGSSSAQKQHRSYSVAVPIPATLSSTDEPLVEINMNKHFYFQQAARPANDFPGSQFADTGHQKASKSVNNLVESPNQKRIFIYTDPKELSSSTTAKEQHTTASSTASNSRRSSLSLGMEIVSAQMNGSPAIVSSIPTNGLIKQFGVDIGEGDEILSVNGHLLRNRSEAEIDQIIGESALETHGELELLVVKQQQQQQSTSKSLEEEPATTEETSSSDALLNESLSSSTQRAAGKIRVVSSSSSSLASNSSSSTNGPRPTMRANSHHAPEPILNDIDENEPVGASLKNQRRNSGTFASSNGPVRKPVPPQTPLYGEGRGFSEISIKRAQQTSPKRDFMITDPAHLLRQRSQKGTTSLSKSPPSPVQFLNASPPMRMATTRQIEQPKPQARIRQLHQQLTLKSEQEPPLLPLPSRAPEPPTIAAPVAEPSPPLSITSLRRQPLETAAAAGARTTNQIENNDVDSLLSSYTPRSSRSPNGLTIASSTLNDDLSSLLSSNTDTNVALGLAPPPSSPKSPKALETKPPPVRKMSGTPFGELQVQLKHDEDEQQIVVKIIRAKNLIARDANGFSDPYVKCYLLPGRDQENKRRTKHVLKSLNPEWNCTVVYPNVHKEELKYKTLEFTVWDWDRFKSNDFLGMVKVELKDGYYLNNQPHWFVLENNAFLNKDAQTDAASEPHKEQRSTKSSKSFKKKSFK